jgi:thiamine pyrophosphate-dependent acetolactate synthase large subunit-like protein
MGWRICIPRKGRVPVVNIVGDHATYHAAHDAQLQSDIETAARNVSTRVRISEPGPHLGTLPRPMARAVKRRLAP